ncbi:hypothetical protein JCM8115_004015 [Rhodotorula mucilaginosa]
MSSDHEQPAPKRQRLDEPAAQPDSHSDSPSSSSSPSSSLIKTFFTEDATGLFKVLASSIGKRAANEEEVGITEYVSPDVQPFSGIIKHRFTDFLVNEVGLDGEVVRLKDIDGPRGNRKNPQETTAGAAQDAPVASEVAARESVGQVETSAETADAAATEATVPAEKAVEEPKAEEAPSLWTTEAEAQVTPLFENNSDKLVEFKAFVEAGPAAGQAKDKRTFVTHSIPDKALRGKFHQTLREAFSSKLVSAHKEGEAGEAPAIEVSWAQTSAGGRNRKRGGASSRGERGDRPDFATLPNYIHFTLHKTNKESHDAMSILSRYFNLTSSRDLGAAGTKDKRAVTVQRISVRRSKTMTTDDIWRAARTGTIAFGGGRGGRGGGRGGRGGMRGGGGGAWVDRMMRIGDVEYADNALELGMLKGNRFMITLRDVETPSIETLHASVASIRERGFINYYGMQRFGTAPMPTHAVGLALLRGEWALAAELLLAERDGEQQDMILARILWKEGKAAEAARNMPRRAVAERAVLEAYSRGNKSDHLGAISTIPKNLRLMYVHSWQSYIWNRLVSERIKLFGASAPVEGDLVYAEQVGDDEPVAADEDGDVVADEAPSVNANAATPAEAAAANPQLAHFIATSSVPKVHALTAQDIESGKYTIQDVVLPMPGFAVQYPAGQLGEVYRRVIREDGINPDDMWRKQKEYSLGGTYRKILHMPQDVSYRLLVSTSPNEDLAQTDEDRVLGRPAPQAREYREEDGPLKEGESLALQIELTLGSSTYATMALREVLKSRTSAATQKSLTQAMEARLKTEAEPSEGAPANEGTQSEVAPTPQAPVE